MMNFICVADGDIPVWMEIASGNQSDKTRFAGLFQDFSKRWTFEGLCVADGALYSADNIAAMNGLKWLTRVPLSINAAATMVDEVVELKPSGIKGYTLKESSKDPLFFASSVFLKSPKRIAALGMIMALS